MGAASQFHKLLPSLFGVLCLGFARLGGAASQDGVSELLKRADELRTANYAQFNSILESVEKRQNSLSPPQREFMRYLRAWKSGYDGDAPTALARLNAILSETKDPTLRLRAGGTAVNMLVFGKRYEEAFSRLSDVLDLLPEVTEGGARQQALLNAAELYNGVGQYDLSLSYAQQVIDTNWGERGFCTGWQQKLQTLYDSNRITTVGAEFRAAIDDCIKVGEVTYANAVRLKAAQSHVRGGKFDEAINLLKQHYDEVKGSRNPRLMARWDVTLADAYRRKGLPALAAPLAWNVTRTVGDEQYFEPLVTAYQVLYELAKQQGDFKAALDFHEQFAAADKAYLTDLGARHLAYQKVNHENIANKLQVDALNKQNHVLQLERELTSKVVETSRLYITLLTLILLFIGLWAYRTKRAQLHFQALSQLDGLTGICNRPHFIAQAERALEASRRTGEQLCVILFDLDHFKLINDRYGHATGDFVLKRTVSACEVHLAKSEVFGRFGGEEFCVLLPACVPEQARQRAEELRLTIAGITAYQGTTKATVSASFGIATTTESGHELGQLLAHADAALYEAKRTGRNRTVIYGKPTEAPPLSIVAATGEFVQYTGRSSAG